MTDQTTDWLPRFVPGCPCAMRLICLPFAGGTARIFDPLAAAAPSWLDVQPVQLPGRENRIAEDPIADLDILVETLAKAIEPALGVPFALLGYSMGARVAFCLARYLRGSMADRLHGLALAAHAWPDPANATRAAAKVAHLEEQSSHAFWQEINSYGGTPAEVIHHPELTELLEPMLRADFRVAFSPLQPRETRLDIPFLLVAGRDDPHADPAAMAGWHSETTGDISDARLDAAHFFIRSHGAEFASIVTDWMLVLTEMTRRDEMGPLRCAKMR